MEENLLSKYSIDTRNHAVPLDDMRSIVQRWKALCEKLEAGLLEIRDHHGCRYHLDLHHKRDFDEGVACGHRICSMIAGDVLRLVTTGVENNHDQLTAEG